MIKFQFHSLSMPLIESIPLIYSHDDQEYLLHNVTVSKPVYELSHGWCTSAVIAMAVVYPFRLRQLVIISS